MPEKTQKQMITEMYGMVQRLDERTLNMLRHLTEINGDGKKRGKRITRLEITIASLGGLLVGAGVLDATHIINIFGG